MDNRIKPGTSLEIEAATVNNAADTSVEIFGVGAGYVAPLPDTIAVEIQNAMDVEIMISTNSTDIVGRTLQPDEAVVYEIGGRYLGAEANGYTQIYVLNVVTADIVVTQLTYTAPY